MRKIDDIKRDSVGRKGDLRNISSGHSQLLMEFNQKRVDYYKFSKIDIDIDQYLS